MTNLGVAMGSLLGAKIISLGRRKMILITSAASIVVLIPTLFKVYWLMVTCKFIWGFNEGLQGLIVARLIEEVLPPKMMKKFGALINLSYAFGAMLSILLGLLLPSDDDTEALAKT
jgi:MFS family permease